MAENESLSERVFRVLLHLYPPAFRDRFGEELLRCFRRDRDRPRFTGLWGRCRFWAHTLGDLSSTAFDEWRTRLPRVRRNLDVHDVSSYLRFAFRSTWRHARVTLIAAGTLAIGIGASTAILSVTKSVLLDPLPYRDAERLALIWSETSSSGFVRFPISGPELNDLRERSETFEEFAAIWTTTGALVEENEPETVALGLVTWNFPALFGADPVLGRSFEPSEEGTYSDALLISEELWQRRFGGEESVLGKTVRVDGGWGFPGGTFTIVGVLPESFRLVLPSDAGVATDPDVLVPFGNDLASGPRGLYYLRTVGRMRSGVSLDEAREEIHAIGSQIESEFPEYDATGRAFNAVSLKGDAIGQTRPVILALLAGTGFLLLVTCTNVASLLLARAAARREEIRLRTALGASGWQIAAHLLAESFALAALGGLGGIALGWLALKPLVALAPAGLPRVEAIAADPTVLGIAFGTSLLCGIFFGLAPVLAVRHRDLYSALRVRGNAGQKGRNLLVVTELALAFVLTVGATLCFRTLSQLQHTDLGFEPDGVLTMELTLPRDRYGSGADLSQFTRELERTLSEIPAVEAAGAINQLPLSDLPNWSSPYRSRASEMADERSNEADGRVVTPGYFEAVGAKLVDGRLFDDADDEGSRDVVIVDEVLARKTWPSTRAVGQEIELEVRKNQGFVRVWAEVVGVVQHMRHHDPRFQVREQFFVPFAQGGRNQMGAVLRARGNPLEIITPAKRAIAAIDKDLAISNVRLLDGYVDDALSVERFTMVLAAAFAASALVLGCIGLYSVMAYSVSCRERELGLRVALGSSSAGIARLVLGRGATLTLVGILLGFAGALATGQLLEKLLYGVAPTDPIALALAPLILAAVALLASWLPARRATEVDPAVVLRQE